MKDKVQTGRGYCCYSTHVCAGEACAAQNESASAGVSVTGYPRLVCRCESCMRVCFQQFLQYFLVSFLLKEGLVYVILLMDLIGISFINNIGLKAVVLSHKAISDFTTSFFQEIPKYNRLHLIEK